MPPIEHLKLPKFTGMYYKDDAESQREEDPSIFRSTTYDQSLKLWMVVALVTWTAIFLGIIGTFIYMVFCKKIIYSSTKPRREACVTDEGGTTVGKSESRSTLCAKAPSKKSVGHREGGETQMKMEAQEMDFVSHQEVRRVGLGHGTSETGGQSETILLESKTRNLSKPIFRLAGSGDYTGKECKPRLSEYTPVLKYGSGNIEKVKVESPEKLNLTEISKTGRTQNWLDREFHRAVSDNSLTERTISCPKSQSSLGRFTENVNSSGLKKETSSYTSLKRDIGDGNPSEEKYQNVTSINQQPEDVKTKKVDNDMILKLEKLKIFRRVFPRDSEIKDRILENDCSDPAVTSRFDLRAVVSELNRSRASRRDYSPDPWLRGEPSLFQRNVPQDQLFEREEDSLLSNDNVKRSENQPCDDSTYQLLDNTQDFTSEEDKSKVPTVKTEISESKQSEDTTGPFLEPAKTDEKTGIDPSVEGEDVKAFEDQERAISLDPLFEPAKSRIFNRDVSPVPLFELTKAKMLEKNSTLDNFELENETTELSETLSKTGLPITVSKSNSSVKSKNGNKGPFLKTISSKASRKVAFPDPLVELTKSKLFQRFASLEYGKTTSSENEEELSGKELGDVLPEILPKESKCRLIASEVFPDPLFKLSKPRVIDASKRLKRSSRESSRYPLTDIIQGTTYGSSKTTSECVFPDPLSVLAESAPRLKRNSSKKSLPERSKSVEMSTRICGGSSDSSFEIYKTTKGAQKQNNEPRVPITRNKVAEYIGLFSELQKMKSEGPPQIRRKCSKSASLKKLNTAIPNQRKEHHSKESHRKAKSRDLAVTKEERKGSEGRLSVGGSHVTKCSPTGQTRPTQEAEPRLVRQQSLAGPIKNSEPNRDSKQSQTGQVKDAEIQLIGKQSQEGYIQHAEPQHSGKHFQPLRARTIQDAEEYYLSSDLLKHFDVGRDRKKSLDLACMERRKSLEGIGNILRHSSEEGYCQDYQDSQKSCGKCHRLLSANCSFCKRPIHAACKDCGHALNGTCQEGTHTYN